MPIDPHELEAELSAYLDGELSPEQAQRVEDWLAQSEDARRQLEELRAVSAGLAALPRLRTPTQLTSTVIRDVERELLVGEPTRRHWGPLLRLWTGISAAAAALLLCTFVGWQMLTPKPATGPITPAPSPSSDLSPIATKSFQTLGYLPAPGGGRGRMAPAPTVALQSEAADEGIDVAGADAVREDLAIVAELTPSSEGQVLLGAPLAAAVDVEQPVIDVTVTADRPETIAALGELFVTWAAETAADTADMAQPLAEQSYEFAISELDVRLSELAAEAPQQVWVEVCAPNGDQHAPLQVGRDAQQQDVQHLAFLYPTPEERYRSGAPVRGGRPFGQKAPPPGSGFAGDPEVAHGFPVRSSTPASAPAETRDDKLDSVDRRTPTRAEEAARREPAHHRGFLDAEANRLTRRELSERHRAVTEEPVIVFVDPPAPAESRPAPATADVRATTQSATTRAAGSSPTSSPSGDASYDSGEAATRDMLDLILRSMHAQRARVGGDITQTAQPVDEFVQVRIRVVPSPVADETPASLPAD